MLSRSVEYALRSVVVLGFRPGFHLPAREIAKQTRISGAYLSKILQMLVRAGLVVSHRGPGGGYDLARPPARMTVLEVVEAVAPIRHDSRGPKSIASRPCSFTGTHHGVDAWIMILREILAHYTVADLISVPGAAPGGQGTHRKPSGLRGKDSAPHVGGGGEPGSHETAGVGSFARRIVESPRFDPPFLFNGGLSMKRAPCQFHWVLASLGVAAASLLVLTATAHSRAAEPESERDRAPERARAHTKLLDDLLKVAIIDVADPCDGPPEAKAAETIFVAAQGKDDFGARLLNAAGAPLTRTRIPGDEFQKREARTTRSGETDLGRGS